MSIIDYLRRLAGWEKVPAASPLSAEVVKVDPEARHEYVRITGTPFFGLWLDVPYDERELAQLRGAVWHKASARWYAPDNADIRPLKRWIPGNRPSTPGVSCDPVAAFADACRAAGLVLDGLPEMDGSIKRVPVETGKRGAKDGAYIGWATGRRPAGYIQNFKTGHVETWFAGGEPMSDAERALYLVEVEAARKARAEELDAAHRAAADDAQVQWASYSESPPRGGNAYLKKKGVGAYGVRFAGPALVVPLRDIEGRLWSLQYITVAGKQLKKGGRKAGNMHLIGEADPGGSICVVEGYATGASVHEATGLPVAVAIDAGNLRAVVEALKKRFPAANVVICGDDDRTSETNTGLKMAEAVALAHQACVVFPAFPDGVPGSDFNDLHAAVGIEAVKEQVMGAVAGLIAA